MNNNSYTLSTAEELKEDISKVVAIPESYLEIKEEDIPYVEALIRLLSEEDNNDL